ncbi:MAG: hypothetical protein ACLVJO_00850 [[Clostridium] scindens]
MSQALNLESHHWEFGIAQFQTALKQWPSNQRTLITADNVRAFFKAWAHPTSPR